MGIYAAKVSRRRPCLAHGAGAEPVVHHCKTQEHRVSVGPLPSVLSEHRCQAVPVCSLYGQESEALYCLFLFYSFEFAVKIGFTQVLIGLFFFFAGY